MTNSTAPASVEDSNFSIGKVFGSLLLLFGSLVIYFSYHFVAPFLSNSPTYRLKALWENDLEALAGSQKLPDGWMNLKQVEVTPLSATAKEWLKDGQVRFATHKDGKFRLEVMVDDWADQGDKGVMIQYNLVDLKSGDTTWELGRTLTVLPKTK